MKLTKIAIAAIAAVSLTSCGGNKTAETTETAGWITDTSVSSEVMVADEVSEAPKASSTDIDEAIDAYDKLMTKCISMSKKATKGDVSIMTEYTSLLEEVEECNRKLEALEGDMTPAQAARFTKIAAKQAQAATELAGDAASLAGDAAEAAAAVANMEIPGL